MSGLGTHPAPTTADQFAAFVTRDHDRWWAGMLLLRTKVNQTWDVGR